MDLNSIDSKTINSQDKVRTCMCNSCCRFLGHQVYIKNNIKGTLRFLGCTDFANGIWCGIELNDQIGESNGCINNVKYFSCEENYGIFVPALETYIIYNSDTSNLSIMEIISSAKSESCHMHLEFQNSSLQGTYKDHNVVSEIPIKNNLNESYTISNHPTKLSAIIEESTILDFSSDIIHVSKLDHISTNCIANKFLKDQIVEDSFSAISQEVHKLLDQNFKETNKSSLSESSESLGIIPELVDLNDCDDVNLDTCLQKNDLNSTFNLCRDVAEKLNGEHDVFIPDLDSNNIFLSSNLPTASHFLSNTESPIQAEKSSLIYASTPKQESQETSHFDDLPSDFHPNKCIDMKPVIEAKTNKTEIVSCKECDVQSSISPIRNENLISENNILNETFEILDNNRILSPRTEMHNNLKDLDTKSVRNEKVIVEEEDKLKLVQTLENYNDEESILNITCDLSRKDDSKEVLKCPIEKKDVLNITCEIESLDNNPLIFNDFKVLKNTENEIENILNATSSYPPESENDNESVTKKLKYKSSCNNNTCFENKTLKMVDTTYEKIDLSPKVNLSKKSMKQSKISMGKIFKSNKENVPLVTTSRLPKENAKFDYSTCDENKNLIRNGCFDSVNTDKRGKSKKQRNSYGSSSSITESIFFDAKSTEFKSEDLHLQSVNVKKISAKKFRKSVSSFGSIDIIKKENYDKEPRRNSFGSSSCKQNSKSLKASIISVPLNLSSQSSNTSVKNMFNMPKSYNQISCVKGLNEKTLSHQPLASKRNIKAENKVASKQDKKCLLNEGTNLASTSSDLGKTVVKKPRKSVFISDPFKIPFEQCETANNQSKTFKTASMPAPIAQNKSSLKMAVCLNANLEEFHDETISHNKTTFKRVSLKSPLTFNKNENKQIRFTTDKSTKHFSSENVKRSSNSSGRNVAIDQPSSSRHVSNLPSYNGQRASGCISTRRKTVSEECKANKNVNLNETMVLNTETNNQKNGKVLNKVQPKKEPFSRIPSVRSKTSSAVLVTQLQNESQKNSKDLSNQKIITRNSTTHKKRSPRAFPK